MFGRARPDSRELQARVFEEDRVGGRGMATTNLSGHPAFKDGAFTSNDRRGSPKPRSAKPMRSIDLGAELGAEVYVFWGGREGTEAAVAKDPRDALDRYREALDCPGDYVDEPELRSTFALEPKPNEPRGDIYLSHVGHALPFIGTLGRPEMVGLNPEVAHETMAGLVLPAWRSARPWAGKLFHIDLNVKRPAATTRTFASGRRTSRRRSCSCGYFSAPSWLCLGRATSTLTPTATRTRTGSGSSRRGCMRTYLALAERARHFDGLPEVQDCARGGGRDHTRRAAVGRRSSFARCPEGGGRRARRARRARLRERAPGPAAGRCPTRRALTRGRPDGDARKPVHHLLQRHAVPRDRRAVVRLLERLGCEIEFPVEQTCCGQMHLNSGYAREGVALARRLARVFAGAEVVVTPSASCARMLRRQLPPEERPPVRAHPVPRRSTAREESGVLPAPGHASPDLSLAPRAPPR